MTQRKVPDQRRRDLARIHLAAKELGMDDEQYRAMLWTVARVESAADLDAVGRRAVLAHLASHKQARRQPHYPGAPHNLGRDEQLLKIEALLAEMRLPWRYADSIARRMWGIERTAWVRSPEHKRGIITALIKRRDKLVAEARDGREAERDFRRRNAQELRRQAEAAIAQPGARVLIVFPRGVSSRIKGFPNGELLCENADGSRVFAFNARRVIAALDAIQEVPKP